MIMSMIVFLVLDYQRKVIWANLLKGEGSKGGVSQSRNSDALKLALAFLSRIRWCLFSVDSLLLSRAYQVFFCPSLPMHWRQLPHFLGSKDLMIPTLLFFSGLTGLFGAMLPAGSYLLGLSVDIYRTAVVLIALHGLFRCLPSWFCSNFLNDNSHNNK